MSVKAAALAAITQDALVPLWRSIAGDVVVVLMLHRFEDRALRIHGDSAPALRANLEFLRRHRIHIASLEDLLNGGAREPSRGGPTVVFTVDDGYADFARIAAPVFEEFDCPVTVFVVTGAIEGKTWFWWDRVTFIIENSTRDYAELELSVGRIRRPRLDAHGHAGPSVTEISEQLKRVPNNEKDEALERLASFMSVDVPALPPPRYAAMTWSDIQHCAQRGVTFGPHTVRHPMLPQVDPATAAREILDSWTQLKANCTATVPVFCYPNGAYIPANVQTLAGSTMRAGVTTEPRYAARSAFVSPDPDVRFAIPRFAYPGHRDAFVQTVTGFERLKMGARGGLRGWAAAGAGRSP